MKVFKTGGYMQLVQNNNISCTCRWGTMRCLNYQNGDKICKHVIELLKSLKTKRKS